MISGLPYIDNTSFYCWVKQEIVAKKMLCCGYKRLYIMKLLMSIFNFVVCVFQEYQEVDVLKKKIDDCATASLSWKVAVQIS